MNLGGAFETGTEEEVAVQESVQTHRGLERIVRAAFEHARCNDRPLVTLVDKANVLSFSGSLWRRVFEAVGTEYEEIPREAVYVDAMAMDLVRRRGRYSVVVTSNLFGDILSDLSRADRRIRSGTLRQHPSEPSCSLRARPRVGAGHRRHRSSESPGRHSLGRSADGLPGAPGCRKAGGRRRLSGSEPGHDHPGSGGNAVHERGRDARMRAPREGMNSETGSFWKEG